MNKKEVMHIVPASLSSRSYKRLIEIILGSRNIESLPTSLAKSIFFLWQRDQLENMVGMSKLLEAAMYIEPEKTSDFFQEIRF